MFLSLAVYSIPSERRWCSVRARKVSEMVSGPTSLSHTLPPAVMLMLSDLMTGEADQFRACRMEDVFPSASSYRRMMVHVGRLSLPMFVTCGDLRLGFSGVLVRRGYASHLICAPMVSLSPHVSCFNLNIVYTNMSGVTVDFVTCRVNFCRV